MQLIHNESEGLTQITMYNYTLSEDEFKPQQNVFERIVRLNLPLFLTVQVWQRHGYTLNDIKTTLEYFPAIHLWQCALLHGISASNSAIKLAFSTPESMVYGSKAIVIRKIEKMISQNYQFSNIYPSVLDVLREDHIPPIPIHPLNELEWYKLTSLLPTTPLTNLLETIYYKNYFQWKDIFMVPLWVEKEAIYTIRIVTEKTFNTSGRTQNTISTRPLDIRIGNDVYCGVEEACFFYLTIPNKKLKISK